MDDFEKEYPGFDWRNIPLKKHPGGRKCMCPKHEYLMEQIRFTKQANKNSREYIAMSLKFCPPHYRLFMDEIVAKLSFLRKIFVKFMFKIDAIQIKQLTHMESDLCYYCKFGSGGIKKTLDLPPM